MPSLIAQTFSALRSGILLPFRIIQFLYRFVFGTYATVRISPEAKEFGDLFRAQLKEPCRYRLDDNSSATLTLPDGHRKIGYAQYGDLQGKAIFMLHGSPGSRLEVARHDELGKRIGARLIGVDRPGVGWSSSVAHRTPIDHAKDVEKLAGHLGIEQFGVIGTSGGGPYVMACCAYFPASQLLSAANVIGLGDVQRFRATGMGWPNWLGFKYLIRWTPWIVRWYAAKEPHNRTDLSEEEKLMLWVESIEKSNPPERDLDCWKEAGCDFMRLCARSTEEAFVNGLDDYMQDVKVLGTKWPFLVEEIRPDLKLHLFFGKEDTNVSGYYGVEIAKRFRGEARLHYLDETHMSMQWRYQPQAIRDVLDDMQSVVR